MMGKGQHQLPLSNNSYKSLCDNIPLYVSVLNAISVIYFFFFITSSLFQHERVVYFSCSFLLPIAETEGLLVIKYSS